MNAKVTLREKITIIKMLSKRFTIGEGAENLINALVRECSEKDKQEERANLILFAFATIAKPLIDDVPVEPLQEEKNEEKIIIRNLKCKLDLVKTVRKVCGIPLDPAAKKVSKVYSASDYTFSPFFIGDTPGSVFTIKQWKEICGIMSGLDSTFDWQSL